MSLRHIETSRLLLSPFTREEINALHGLWTNAGMRKYLWDDEIISSEKAAAVVASSIESFEAHGFGFWCILLKEAGDRLIGFCGLRHFQEDHHQLVGVAEVTQVEILYGIAPEHWNKGFASEAARAVLQFGFEQVGHDRIYAGADPPNIASIKVMEKLGMRFARQTLVNGLDATYYAIGREDFKVWPADCAQWEKKIALK